MAFTAQQKKEYRNSVLIPLKGARAPQLRKAVNELQADRSRPPQALDLAEFYGVREEMSDGEILQQVADASVEVSSADRNPTLRSIAGNLKDLNRLVTQNFAVDDPAFWRQCLAERAQRSAQALADFARAVASECGDLRLVPRSRMRAMIREAGLTGLPEAKVEKAVRDAGIEVSEDISEPSITLDGHVFDILSKTSYPSILDAVFLAGGPPPTFTILDGFSTPEGGYALTLSQLDKSRELQSQLPTSDDAIDALGKVIGSLQTRASTNDELYQLVVAYFIGVGKRAAKTKTLRPLLLQTLTDTGLDHRDAARIVWLVAGEATSSGFPDVLDLVQKGQLKEARRLFDLLKKSAGDSASDSMSQAQSGLEGAEQRTAALREEADRAVEAGDVEAAAKALNAALTICTDDESLDRLASGLPPAKPLNLVVGAASDTVAMSWDPGFGNSDDVRFAVTRKRGSAPRNIHDGEMLAKDLAQTSYTDLEPPLATRLFYAVAGTRGKGYSPVANQEITVVPPVDRVQARGDSGRVTLQWRPARGARGVRVVQTAPDGTQRELAPQSQGGLESTGLTDGVSYLYSLTAFYASPSGDIDAEPVIVACTPRGEARPVSTLAVTPRAGTGGVAEMEATWEPMPGFSVEVWHFREAPKWSRGTRIPMKDVAARGERLTGVAVDTGGKQGVRGIAPLGIRHYLALTRDNDDAVIGNRQVEGLCPPLASPRAERFGDQVVINWDWRDHEFDVRARWSVGQTVHERTMSRATYRNEGGLRLTTGTGTTQISLAYVMSNGEDTWASAENVISIPGSLPVVEYSVAFGKRPFGPPRKVTFTFTARDQVSRISVIAVAATGQVMPNSPASGISLGTSTLDLVNGKASIEFPLAGLGKHFWVRAFPAPGSELRLVDPPTNQLKGA